MKKYLDTNSYYEIKEIWNDNEEEILKQKLLKKKMKKKNRNMKSTEQFFDESKEKQRVRLLTSKELNSFDIYLQANENEKISIRNLIKILEKINKDHFEIVLRELGYEKRK